MAKRYNANESDREKLLSLLDNQPPPPRKKPVREQAARHGSGGIRFKNSSGEEIPPFAVMQCDDADLDRESPFVTVVKPTSSGKLFLINGPRAIPENKYGRGFREGRALFVGTSLLPELWSPVDGEWHLSNGGAHFRLAGSLDAETSYFLLTGEEYDTIEGVTTTAVAGEATFEIDNVLVVQGTNPLADPSDMAETVEIQNRFAQHADDGSLCIAHYNRTRDYWQVLFLNDKCPPSE